MARLLIVTPYASTAGGAEQWLLGILREPALKEAGWTVDAIVMQEGPLVAVLREAGVTTIAVPIPASPHRIAARAPALRAAIQSRRPDVVVSNGVKAQLAVSCALVGTGIPTVWVKHDHSHDAVLARTLGRSATLVVSTALEAGQPTRRQDLVVIEPPRPPLPLPASQARAVLSERGWQQSRPLVLGMISRLVPYKGVDMAVVALADPRAEPWELVVIGGDDPATPNESHRLLALAADNNVSDRVFLAGEIPGGGRLLSACDAAAVLTRPGQPGAPTKEGYGIVATEAMLAEIPVIVAQPGPISRRLQTSDGPAGITLARPTSSDLASALDELTDAEIRTALGRRGREVSRDLPEQRDVAQAFCEVLATVSRS